MLWPHNIYVCLYKVRDSPDPASGPSPVKRRLILEMEDRFLTNACCVLASYCLFARWGVWVEGPMILAPCGSSQDTMLAFEKEVAELKQTARFRKIQGELPTKTELKVSNGLA